MQKVDRLGCFRPCFALFEGFFCFQSISNFCGDVFSVLATLTNISVIEMGNTKWIGMPQKFRGNAREFPGTWRGHPAVVMVVSSESSQYSDHRRYYSHCSCNSVIYRVNISSLIHRRHQ